MPIFDRLKHGVDLTKFKADQLMRINRVQSEIDVMRQKLAETEAKAQKESERLKQLKDREKRPAAPVAPLPSPPNIVPPPSAPQPQAPQPTAPQPTPALPPPQQSPRSQQSGENGVLIPPAILRQVAPAYPVRARLLRFEVGSAHRVRVRVQVDEAGRPQSAAVVEGVPGPYGFDESAREAAMKSSFAPARKGGQPVPGSLEIIFVFQPLGR